MNSGHHVYLLRHKIHDCFMIVFNDGDGDDDGDDGPEGFFWLVGIAPLIVLSTQQGSTYTQCVVCVV